MAASVVYEGVGGGGILFEGTKFWIALRVPSRQRYVDLVQANGGTVVSLERDADILIADHAKPKLAPAGSISWKFIEDSCRNGKLESLEDYPAGPPKGAVRTVGSSAPARGYRVQFTPEDDRILMKWVLAAEREGKTLKGMAMYENLERVNPRHTSQSWRDRWVKILQFRPRPQLDDNQEEEVERDSEISQLKAAALTSRLPAMTSGPAPKVTPVEVPPRRRKPPLIHVNKLHAVSSTKPNFTDKDLELLDSAYDEILDIEESLVDAAWKAFAQQYPQHTAKEWFKYWTDCAMPQLTKQRALAPSELTDEASLMDSEDSPRPSRGIKYARLSEDYHAPYLSKKAITSTREESSRREQNKSSLNRSRDVSAELPPPLHHPSWPRKKFSTGGGSAACMDPKATFESNIVNNKTVRIGASPRSTTSGKTYNPVNAHLPRSSMRSGSTSFHFRALHDKDEATEYRPAIRDMIHKSFDEDFRLFIKKQNAHSPLPFEPFEMTQMVSGRPVELARLWELVTSPENGGFENVSNRKRWPAIASQLNFNVLQYPEVWRELSDIYERYLADFDDAIVSFWKSENEYGTIDDHSLGGIAAIAADSGLHATGGNDAHSSSESEHDFDDDLELPSPLVVLQRKAKLGSERHHRPSVSHSRRPSNKRRRIDEGKDRDRNIEIPLTPEAIQDSVDVDGQDSSQENLSQTNPVGRRLFHARHTITNLTTMEPETQDFYFAKPVDEASGSLEIFETAQQTLTKGDAVTEVASGDDDSSTQSQTDSQRKKSEDFQRFVDFHIGLGYEEDTVHEALEATTLTTENASLVMEHLQAGRGIPANMEGVWTTDDDRIAREGGNGSEFKRIKHKHGLERCEERMKFLDMLASAESDS